MSRIKMHSVAVFLMSPIIFSLVVSVLFFSKASAEPSSPLEGFMEEAAGRYITGTDEGTAVLELIPAFGHLFGSVGYYTEGSLYSYYAAEFTPACWFAEEKCPAQYTSHSMDFIIRFYSNMSKAGSYWDGLSQQRLTIAGSGLLLSDYAGNGDGLISKETVLLSKSEKAPSMFPYNAERAESLLNGERTKIIPAFLTQSFRAFLKEDDAEITQQISFDENGGMMLLRQTSDLTPPLLLKGGYALAENEDGSFELCFLMSSPASGTMPYGSCAVLREYNDVLIIEESESDWNRLLTGSAASRIYHIG